MDANLYLISAAYVSEAKFRKLADKLVAAAPCEALAIRLEGSGGGLWAALDRLAANGATRIEIRPIGLPFSQSLERWLPGAAGAWLDRYAPPAPALFFAEPPGEDDGVTARAARARVRLRPVARQPGGERGKGWDAPPPEMRHHLLVCTGPRCHLRDAPGLVPLLKEELGKARQTSRCLITATGCIYPCNHGPVLVHYPAGRWYRLPDAAAVRDFVRIAISGDGIARDYLFHTTGEHHEPA